MQEVATIRAHHVSDFDHHLRAMRAANAELRDRIVAARAELEQAEEERRHRAEVQRALGARALAVELEIERARIEADEHLLALIAAADEEVRHILDAGHAEAAQLRQAVEAVVGSAEPAAVVNLSRRTAAEVDADEEASHAERSVAM